MGASEVYDASPETSYKHRRITSPNGTGTHDSWRQQLMGKKAEEMPNSICYTHTMCQAVCMCCLI